jgi:hypothetical protein
MPDTESDRVRGDREVQRSQGWDRLMEGPSGRGGRQPDGEVNTAIKIRRTRPTEAAGPIEAVDLTEVVVATGAATETAAAAWSMPEVSGTGTDEESGGGERKTPRRSPSAWMHELQQFYP